jgi:hypothetical protein
VAIFITAYNGGGTTHEITFLDGDGAEVVIAANDKVRVKIGRAGSAPLIDMVSGTPLNPGGSTVTKANPAVLTLRRGDLTANIIKPGAYDIEAYIVDSGDSNHIKHAESGVFTLIDGQTGGVD